MESGRPGELYELPVAPIPAAEIALEELELVYAFVYARVGNRPDAEDLTQQVALKAIPRLREGASVSAIRAYLFATARSALATFWASRFGMPEDELRDDLWVEKAEPDATGEPVERVPRGRENARRTDCRPPLRGRGASPRPRADRRGRSWRSPGTRG